MTALFTKTMFAGTEAGKKPEYMSLLGLKGEDRLLLVSGEYGRYVLTIDDSVVWQSPLLRLRNLMNETYHIPESVKRKGRKRLYLEYIKRKNGRAFSGWFRASSSLQTPKGGVGYLIPSNQSVYPPAARTARRWASRQVQLSRVRRPPVPKKSTLRPAYEFLSRPFLKTQEYWNPGYNYSPSIIGLKVLERTWTGVRTPNFGKLRKRALPVNPHSVLLVYRNKDTSFAGSFNKNTGWSTINIRPFTDVYADQGAPEHLALARNKCIAKLIDKAELGLDANLAQDVAQIGQTFRLISSSMNRITGSVSNLRRGNIPAAISSLMHGRQGSSTIRKGTPSVRNSLANNWLELQYGWKPLLWDIEGSLKSLANFQGAGDFVQSVADGASAYAYGQSVTPAIAISGQGSNMVTFKSQTKTVCKIGYRFRLASPVRALIAQTGFSNPVNLVWEILPFSFVVDWFLPIGPYLEAFSAYDGLEFLDGYQVQFTRHKTGSSYHNEQVSTLNALNTVFEHSEYEKEFVKLDRIKLNSFPTPTFPELKNGLASNVKRAANAFALLQQVFAKR